jgi:glutamyl-tRNA synthetase/nondiscriminating glutamyl-tRNA synthetase
MPVYNYVVVVDDALMKITHVIRGDDHLSNTPKQVAVYEALGWPVPEFAHLSTILGHDRERLSKRHGATSIANFRDMGVLPEALVNYLALLGWAPAGGNREVFSRPELVKEFSLERITPSPAVFDMEKLYWLNRHYIKDKSPGDLYPQCVAFLVRSGVLSAKGDANPSVMLPAGFREWFLKVIELLAPSVDRLEQLPERAALIFHYDAAAALAAPDNAEVLGWQNTGAVIARFTVKILEDDLAIAGQMTPERFKQIVNEVKAETGAKGKELFHPIRLMVTGSHSGPEFDKLIPILEEGSHLDLLNRVLSLRARVETFGRARA